MTILVGRNAAGKSNFLDALSFVTESLSSSLDHAIRARGGFGEVLRKGAHRANLAVELEILLPQGSIEYGFELETFNGSTFRIENEHCEIRFDGRPVVGYKRQADRVATHGVALRPPAIGDRLSLVAFSSLPEFRPAFDALTAMGTYNLDPRRMRELVSPDAGELLHRDGGNIASVIARLEAIEPELLERICEYLGRIVPGVLSVRRIVLGPSETLLFQQPVADAGEPASFYATSMSDGTLRVLGALVAASQLTQNRQPVRLVGIEEPETALHPAAVGLLMEALRELGSSQILITTHSPDLLDHADLDSGQAALLAVEAVLGDTRIARIDRASIRAIQDQLYSPGELLRLDQLQPDPADLRRQELTPVPT